MGKMRGRTKHIFLMVVILFMMFGIQVQAKDLDKLDNYVIEVDHYSDGSLEIQYHLEWRVLDSTSEGPLTWIRVGIPNAYVEEITALSTNIDKIGYSGSDGDYVRIDLDREYEAGEVVEIDFSIHQHRMYQERGAYYNYSFTPGWFDEMVIDEMVIRWKAYEGMHSDLVQENGYYVARKEDLAHGQKMEVKVSYDKESFAFQDDYDEVAGEVSVYLVVAAFVGIPIICVLYLLFIRPKRKDRDYYNVHSGMGRAYYNNHVSTRHSSGGHRSGGCACACACACAGGGRAGCSVKEFYSAKKWSLRRTRKDL